MFHSFDKQSLFFLTDNNPSKNVKINDEKIHLEYLSNFLSELQFIIYYIDFSLCNNIVFLNPEKSNEKLLKYLFPQLNFYFNYEEDLKILSENNIPFCIISNINNDEMEFQKLIIEKYQPYAALLDFHFSNQYEIKNYKYLNGLLMKKIFYKKFSLKLVVRGIGYKDYNLINLTKNLINSNQKCKYINPISNDNKTIFKERGFYNNFDETATIIIVMDYLKKFNKDINFDRIIKLLIYILDNLIKNKKINLDIESVIS